MLAHIDPVILARIQFAFTISFHIIFPAFTIGLASWLAVIFNPLAFIITYIFVFGAGSYYILRLIGKGPGTREKAYGDHGIKTPPLVTNLGSETGGGKNV